MDFILLSYIVIICISYAFDCQVINHIRRCHTNFKLIRRGMSVSARTGTKSSQAGPLRILCLAIISFFLISAAISLTSGPAYAASDFQAVAPQASIQACTCVSAKAQISIYNTGNSAGIFQLYATGDNAAWSTLVPGVVRLDPGKSATISHYINPPCGQTGTYNLGIVIQSDSGVSKQITQNVVLSNCQNLQVLILNSSQGSCSCTERKFNFIVKNSGQYVEAYDARIMPSSDSLAGTALVDPQEIVLNPGEAKLVSAIVKPGCFQYGELGYTFEVLARTSKYLAKAPIKYVSSECFDYELNGPTGQPLSCLRVESSIPVGIRNIGEEYNSFTAWLALPEGSEDGILGWTHLEHYDLSLEPGASGQFTVKILPPADAGQGLHELSFQAQSDKGQVLKSQNLLLNVTECMGAKISLFAEKQTVCCGVNSFDFNLQNTGTLDSAIILSVDSYAWAEPRKMKYFLEPGQAEAGQLVIDVPCFENSYDLTLNAKTEGHESIADSGTIRLDVKTPGQCFELQPELEKVKIEYSNYSIINFTVANIGLKPSRYRVSLVDVPYWVRLNTTTISVNDSDIATFVLEASINESVHPDKYRLDIRFDSTSSNATYVLPFYITVKRKYTIFHDAIVWAGQFVRQYSDYFVIIAALIVILWVLNKAYSSYRQKKLAKIILESQAQHMQQLRLSQMTALQRRRERKRLKLEAKQERLAGTESRKRMLQYIQVAGIMLVIAVSLLLFFTKYKETQPEKFQNQTFVQDIFVVVSDLKDYAIKPFMPLAANETETPSSEPSLEGKDRPVLAINRTLEINISKGTPQNDTSPSPKGTSEKNISEGFVNSVSSNAPAAANITIAEPEPIVEKDESFTYQVIYIGEQKEIDLSQYFVDPDSGDRLQFTFSSSSGLDVRMQDSIVAISASATARPGYETIFFTATDSEGLSVTSPEITVVVRPARGSVPAERRADATNSQDMDASIRPIQNESSDEKASPDFVSTLSGQEGYLKQRFAQESKRQFSLLLVALAIIALIIAILHTSSGEGKKARASGKK